jgi:hypothetical protein
MAAPYRGAAASLGTLLKYGHGLRGICLACWHTQELDVLALSLRFGEAYAVPEIARFLRCTACTGTRCSVQVISPDSGSTWLGAGR